MACPRSWFPLLLLGLLAAGPTGAQEDAFHTTGEEDRVSLDFQDTELTDVINMISRLTRCSLTHE